jgi:DNA polymerase IV
MSRPPEPAELTEVTADDAGCTIMHVDMDAFYASVELIDRPELRGRPVIVAGSGGGAGAAGGAGAGGVAGAGGGSGGRSVVLSATYEARRDGVHAAMPLARARRVCPEAVVIEADHQRYAEVSQGVMEIFRSITPLVEPLSLDEAFLDVSGAIRRLGPPTLIARRIRDRVADEQRITASVGIATSKFVAKLASGRSKPDGLMVVPRRRTVVFLHALPVGALWGVGERTEETLRRLGLVSVADIAHTPVATLRRALGDTAGAQLHDLSWGRDLRPVVPEQVEKSIGAEETFRTDVDDPEVVRRELLRLSERVTARVRAAGMLGRTVVIKIRFADFTTITRSRTLREHTDISRVVHATALDLYTRLGLDRARLRLVGVRIEGLIDAAAGHHQLALGERAQGWREADQAVDRASARFGAGAVRSASLVGERGDERVR